MRIPIVCSVPVYELDSLSKMSKLRPATAAGKASLSYRHPVYRGGGGLADFESSTEFNKKGG